MQRSAIRSLNCWSREALQPRSRSHDACTSGHEVARLIRHLETMVHDKPYRFASLGDSPFRTGASGSDARRRAGRPASCGALTRSVIRVLPQRASCAWRDRRPQPRPSTSTVREASAPAVVWPARQGVGSTRPMRSARYRRDRGRPRFRRAASDCPAAGRARGAAVIPGDLLDPASAYGDRCDVRAARQLAPGSSMTGD